MILSAPIKDRRLFFVKILNTRVHIVYDLLRLLTRDSGSTRRARRGGNRFESRVITEDIKNDSYCYYVRYAILIVRVGGISWLKTGATYYHAQLGLLRQSSCNQRVGCLMGVS